MLSGIPNSGFTCTIACTVLTNFSLTLLYPMLSEIKFNRDYKWKKKTDCNGVTVFSLLDNQLSKGREREETRKRRNCLGI